MKTCTTTIFDPWVPFRLLEVVPLVVRVPEIDMLPGSHLLGLGKILSSVFYELKLNWNVPFQWEMLLSIKIEC